MERIKNIEIVSQKFLDSYYKILNQLLDYINKIKKKGLQQIEKLRDKRDDVDFSLLRRYLYEIKYFEWINKLKEGSFESLQKDLNYEIEDYYH